MYRHLWKKSLNDGRASKIEAVYFREGTAKLLPLIKPILLLILFVYNI